MALDGDTVLAIGETLACVVPVPDATRSPVPGCGPAIVHNRRRRPARPAPLPRVVLPDPPPAEPAPRPMGWAALAIPVIFGLVMAVLVDPRMALFAFARPTRHGRGAGRRPQAAAPGPPHRHCHERFRRRHPRHHPRPAPRPESSVAAAPTNPVWRFSPGGWNAGRRGCGSGAAATPISSGSPSATGTCRGPPISPAIRTTRRARWPPPSPATSCRPPPLTLDLGGRVLGLVGDRVNALELGRGLLCSAAVLHGPSDLAVAVVTDRPADWDWVKWLPHVMVAPTDRRRLLAGDAIETVAVLDWIATRPGAGQQRPVVLVVVDRGPLTDPPGLAVRRVLGGATGVRRGRHRPGGRGGRSPRRVHRPGRLRAPPRPAEHRGGFDGARPRRGGGSRSPSPWPGASPGTAIPTRSIPVPGCPGLSGCSRPPARPARPPRS